jgi:hypothetical protein
MEKHNEIQYWILKFISDNYLGAEGASKIGDGVSKLLNLTSLNLDFT